MSDEKSKAPGSDDAEIEREVRSHRKFSLAEAIGRAGGDLMKGASPVTRKRQADLEIEHHLERHLADSEGALLVVLQRRVRESEILLAESYDRPLGALARVVQQILDSEASLRRFVKQVDAEWGRIYSERPYFESEGAPPRPEDPYTLASVRASLSRLAESLRGDVEA